MLAGMCVHDWSTLEPVKKKKKKRHPATLVAKGSLINSKNVFQIESLLHGIQQTQCIQAETLRPFLEFKVSLTTSVVCFHAPKVGKDPRPRSYHIN